MMLGEAPTPLATTLSSPQPPAAAPGALRPLTCASFRVTGPATGCTLVLVLLTTVLSSTGALPVPTPLRTLPGATGCHVAQFQSLPPQELKAFKKAKDALEAPLLLKNWTCSSRPFPRTRDLRQLQVGWQSQAQPGPPRPLLWLLGGPFTLSFSRVPLSLPSCQSS